MALASCKTVASTHGMRRPVRISVWAITSATLSNTRSARSGAAGADLDTNDRLLVGKTGAARDDGEGGVAAVAQPHGQRIGQVPGGAWGFS